MNTGPQDLSVSDDIPISHESSKNNRAITIFILLVCTIVVFFVINYIWRLYISNKPGVDTIPTPTPTPEVKTFINEDELQQHAGEGVTYYVDQSTGFTTALVNDAQKLTINEDNLEIHDTSAVADQVIEEYSKYFGIKGDKNTLIQDTIKKDAQENSYVVYQQEHKEIPVFGGQTIVHLDAENSVSALTGSVAPNVSVNIQPVLDEQQGIAYAKQYWLEQFGEEAEKVDKVELLVLSHKLLMYGILSEDQLVWRVDLSSPPILNEHIFVSAHTGDLVYQTTGMIQLDEFGASCNDHLPDCDVQRDIYLCDEDENCYKERAEGQASSADNEVNDMYNIFEKVHEYFLGNFEIWGANSYGGIGNGYESFSYNKTAGIVKIDYLGEVMSCPNAFFTGYAIATCEGLVIDDVVAHEYMHAVVHYQGNGIADNYQGETGAINEAYADFFGEAANYDYVEGTDWEMGTDIDAGGLVGPIRSLKDPTKTNNPKTKYSDRYICDPYFDYGGVHINSTVLSHAAYLMVEGGESNGCIINKIGISKTEQILYLAMSSSFTTSTTFRDAYTYINMACEALLGSHGISLADCEEVKASMQATELDQPGRCSTIARVEPECAQAVVPTNTPTSTPVPPSPTVTPSEHPYPTVIPSELPVVTNTPTATVHPTVTVSPTTIPEDPEGVVCGPIDEYAEGDSISTIGIRDFIAFAKVYLKQCSDDDEVDSGEYDPCGGKNRRNAEVVGVDKVNSKIDINDFIYFAKVYKKDSCLLVLPETGVEDFNIGSLKYVGVLVVEVVVAGLIILRYIFVKKNKNA